MKNIIYTIIILLSFNHFTFGQCGWFQLYSGTNTSFNSCFFLNSNTGFIAADSGRIFKTTSGGHYWNIINFNTSRNFNSVYFADNNTGFACGDSSLITKTTNGGLNWFLQVLNTQTSFRSVFFINAETGYMAAINGNIFKTTNSGANWTEIETGSIRWLLDVRFINYNTGYSVGGNFDIEGNIFKTTDGGLNWSKMFSTPEPINSVYFVNDYTGYVVGGDVEYGSTIFKTINGGINWIDDPHPIFTPGLLKSVKFTGTDTGYCAGTFYILKTIDEGTNWRIQRTINNPELTSIFMINSLTGFTVGANGVILKTTNGGFAFSVSGEVNYQDDNQPVSSGYVKAINFDSVSMEIMTIDSVQILSGTFSLTHIPPGIHFEIMAFENDEDDMQFVPTYYPSTTNWQNAVTLTSDSDLTNKNIQVYRVTNPGGSLHIGGHITKQGLNPYVGLNTAIVYAKSGSLYQGYSMSDNNGAFRVDSLSTGTYNLIVDRMGFSEMTREVILTNFSKDTIDFTMDKLVGLELQNQVIPKAYWLGVNYPNPFNPETKIEFGIPKDAKVSLVIYDILGREVTKLINEELKAGVYGVNWNASSYASGIYFYILQAGDPSTGSGRSFVQTKKMVLVK